MRPAGRTAGRKLGEGSSQDLYLFGAFKYLNLAGRQVGLATLSKRQVARSGHTRAAAAVPSKDKASTVTEKPSFALVTGASQGLGRIFAIALAARGQNVILVARSRDKLEKLASELRQSQSVIAEVIEFDLASPLAGPRLAQQVRDRNLQVNLFVNNAGFGVRGEFQTLTIVRGGFSADSLRQPVFSDEIVSDKFLFGASGRTPIEGSKRGYTLPGPNSCREPTKGDKKR